MTTRQLLQRCKIGTTVVALVALLCACAFASPAKSAKTEPWTGLRVQGRQIVDQSGYNILLKGLDPGGWYNTEAYMLKWPDHDHGPVFFGYTLIHQTLVDLMGRANAREFWHRWHANIVTERDVRRWASWGVNSVRLSINYRWLSPAEGVYLASGWRRIDRLIDWCKKYHIYVILCLHAAPGSQNGMLMSDGDGVAKLWTEGIVYQSWTIKLWKKIAQRYANTTTVAGYDLLDEPIPPPGDAKDVRAFYVRVTKAIRSVDPHHIIFAEGLDFAMSVKGMQALEPAWDKNMVFVFHKYWDKNSQASIQGYLDISKRENRPLWDGETGENTNLWARHTVALMKKNNIGYNWWTYKKVGQATQPYTINAPAGYQIILAYVHGKGPKPSRAEATRIMLALADNAATAECTLNAATVEAVFGVLAGRLASPPDAGATRGQRPIVAWLAETRTPGHR